MSHEGDPLDLLLRALARMRAMRDELLGLMEAAAAEDLFEERIRMLSEGVLEPLVEIHDLGDEILLVVDTAGARPETVQVLVGEDRVEVMGEADERVVREALGSWYYRARTRRFHGVYALPAPIDASTVRVEKRGSTIIVRARKRGA